MSSFLSLSVLPYALTLAFWLSSLAVLALRRWSPAFCSLVRYGGRVVEPDTDAASVKEGEKGERQRGGVTSHMSSYRGGEIVKVLVNRLSASWLGTVRVRRRSSFLLFYLVGCASVLALTATAAARSGSAAVFESQLPLLCFGLHCAWRLVETLTLFNFRSKAQDNVSLFAALSGAVFYVFAALSCDAVPVRPLSAGADEEVPLFLAPIVRQLLLAVLNIILFGFLIVQLAQTWVHGAIAGLRGRTDDVAKEEARETGEIREKVVRKIREAFAPTPEAAVPLLSEPKLLSYHFPAKQNPLFALVLEPHYTCEVLLYALNVLSVAAISWACWTSCGCSTAVGKPVAVAGPREGCAPLRTNLLLRLACAAGLLVFTTCNLAITAAEHRAFWLLVNRERTCALRRIRETAVSLAKEHDAKVVKEEESAWYACVFMLRQERLPLWNLLYGIC